mmetsp:Transcript_137201/g.382696  ORF Transcript_137201/g.382696 Transcript_137201/m.382696 type:complete len:499 (+) Transcript_137201:447-1943(+)
MRDCAGPVGGRLLALKHVQQMLREVELLTDGQNPLQRAVRVAGADAVAEVLQERAVVEQRPQRHEQHPEVRGQHVNRVLGAELRQIHTRNDSEGSCLPLARWADDGGDLALLELQVQRSPRLFPVVGDEVTSFDADRQQVDHLRVVLAGSELVAKAPRHVAPVLAEHQAVGQVRAHVEETCQALQRGLDHLQLHQDRADLRHAVADGTDGADVCREQADRNLLIQDPLAADHDVRAHDYRSHPQYKVAVVLHNLQCSSSGGIELADPLLEPAERVPLPVEVRDDPVSVDGLLDVSQDARLFDLLFRQHPGRHLPAQVHEAQRDEGQAHGRAYPQWAHGHAVRQGHDQLEGQDHAERAQDLYQMEDFAEADIHQLVHVLDHGNDHVGTTDLCPGHRIVVEESAEESTLQRRPRCPCHLPAELSVRKKVAGSKRDHEGHDREEEGGVPLVNEQQLRLVRRRVEDAVDKVHVDHELRHEQQVLRLHRQTCLDGAPVNDRVG